MKGFHLHNRAGGSPGFPIDDELLHRLKQSLEDSSWHKLYLYYSRLFLALARRRGLSPAQSEDLAEDALIILVRKILETPSIGDTPEQLERWAVGVALHKISSSFRYSERAERLNPQSLYWSRSPDDQALWDERCDLLAKAIEAAKKLATEHDYLAFKLTFIDQLGPEEAARQLRTSTGSVYAANARFKKLIRLEFAPLLNNK